MGAILPILFGLVALIYALVGFGGGSSYTALLTLSGIEHRLIPIISLACNIVVVSGGTIRFAMARLIDVRRFVPLLLVSAPLAFIGGLVPLKEQAFLFILGSALFLSAAALLLPVHSMPKRQLPRWLVLTLSGLVGLLAGMSGIGGGIFMAPVLHIIRWAEARRIAAFASLYILVNSITGLTGQLAKGGWSTIEGPLASYLPLVAAVFIGGQLGSWLGLKILSPSWLRRLTALLVGYAALRLLWQGVSM